MLLAPMLSRLSAARTLTDALDVAVRDFVSLHGAEMGDVQLVGARGDLVIVAARGVSRTFLEVFERVAVESGSICGRAARDLQPTYVPDVSVDPEYARYHAFAASVPFRAVLSYPLHLPGGPLVGMLSALSSQPFKPTKLEFDTAQAYCAKLSAIIAKAMGAEQLPAWADAAATALLAATPARPRVAARM